MRRKYLLQGNQYERTRTLYLLLWESKIMYPEVAEVCKRLFVEETAPEGHFLELKNDSEYLLVSRLSESALKLSFVARLHEDDNQSGQEN